MKIYLSAGAPNPRRVQMFLVEKGINQIETTLIDLNAQEHRSAQYLAISPLAKVPALVLDDGRTLTESRAICTYLEGVYPQPNLMGVDATERAFIEMADRRAELELLANVAYCVRHTHPGLAVLEPEQFADFGRAQADKVRRAAAWFDAYLRDHEWLVADRFTVADITAFCAIEFARLMRFNAGREGFAALQAWRDRVAARPSAAMKT